MYRWISVVVLAAATLATVAKAQTYPTRPVTIIVPFVAGGPVDTIGRILSERMRIPLGQPIVIENVGGAAGSLGVGRAAKAAADGYTLSLGNSATHVINGAIYPLSYDVLSDFEPISLIVSQPELVVARKTMPADDLAGLVAWLKTNADKASQGTSGVGSAGHVAGVFFQRVTSTRYQFVPYRGLAPAMQDLLAGQVDMLIDVPASSVPQIRSGTIKAYAVTAKERLAAVPQVPTVDEAGLPGFYASVWYAVWTPKGTPRSVVTRLSDAVNEALADPTVQQRLADLGMEVFPAGERGPEPLAALHKAEIEKWWPIIKAANIKGE
ncbi:MAG: tripartite tricarboxylate transporter substrate binding protein BugD [Hyphomicrobiales bacterium]|nr:tripartite tricarboxylate transporter substrate binding protein BugD [Hyphomicrobiales bacterium]